MDKNAKLPANPDAEGPLTLVIGVERIEIRSPTAAVDLLRSLSFDMQGTYVAALCARMQAARTPAEGEAAWADFRKWAQACGLVDGTGGSHPFKRAA